MLGACVGIVAALTVSRFESLPDVGPWISGVGQGGKDALPVLHVRVHC